jgi:hypothetical protein
MCSPIRAAVDRILTRQLGRDGREKQDAHNVLAGGTAISRAGVFPLAPGLIANWWVCKAGAEHYGEYLPRLRTRAARRSRSAPRRAMGGTRRRQQRKAWP